MIPPQLIIEFLKRFVGKPGNIFLETVFFLMNIFPLFAEAN
jgi:hypothetical protein